MKKLFTTMLCLMLTFCIVLAAGCDISRELAFRGSYTEVQASEISTFSQSVAETEREIDLNKGIEFNYVSEEVDGKEYENETISFKTQIVNDSLLMSGESVEEENENGVKTESKTEIYYDRDTLYRDNGVKKEYMKVPFKEYISLMMQSFGTLTLDATVARFSNDANAKFYIDEGSKSTKIKVEYERIDGDDKETQRFCFKYNADKLLTGIFVEYREEDLLEKDDYKEVYISIEAYDGEVELPSDLGEYKLVSLFD